MNLENQLMIAVSRHDITAIASLLRQGAEVNTTNKKGETPLHLSVGRTDIVNLLLENEASVDVINFLGEAPLHYAAGNRETVHLLLQYGASAYKQDKKGDTPLHNAARVGEYHVVNSLLVWEHTIYTIDMQNQEGKTALHEAVLSGESKAVAQLLAREYSPYLQDAWGETPLHKAFTIRMVEQLLECGASLHVGNNYGETPLHTAGPKNALVTKLLLSKGSLPHVKDKDGNTPLHAAAESASDPLIIKILLKQGAILDVKNHHGMTPLHVAVRFSKHLFIMKQLLAKGALVNVRDKKGKTPLSYVVRVGRNKYLPFGREREQADQLDKEKIVMLLAHGACIDKQIECYLLEHWKVYRVLQVNDDKSFFTSLLIAGTSPPKDSLLSQHLKSVQDNIEATVQLWLSPCIHPVDREAVNWYEMTAKVLQALPTVISMQRVANNNAFSIESGYTFSKLKAFLFMSKKFKYTFAQLSTVRNLQRKQLPVELITMIRACLVNQLVVHMLKFDHQLDAVIANYLAYDIKLYFENYVIFHRRLFQHNWDTICPLPPHLATLEPAKI